MLDLLLDRELLREAGGLPRIALEGLERVVVLAKIGLESDALVLGPAIELVHPVVKPRALPGADVAQKSFDSLLCAAAAPGQRASPGGQPVPSSSGASERRAPAFPSEHGVQGLDSR